MALNGLSHSINFEFEFVSTRFILFVLCIYIFLEKKGIYL